jgi:formate-dependent nitrite reductase membrane component NrfD
MPSPLAAFHWHDSAVWYLYLSGIAAGAYLTSSLLAAFGDENDHPVRRIAAVIAFPLVCVCALLVAGERSQGARQRQASLSTGSDRPILQFDVSRSIGSMGLAVFATLTFASFVAALLRQTSARRRRLPRSAGWIRLAISIVGTASSIFVATYTGVLQTPNGQPVWPDTTWIGPLFLATSASTGLAAVLGVARSRRVDLPHAACEHLERACRWCVALTLVIIVALTVALGEWTRPALGRWPGLMIPLVVVPAGLIFPLLLQRAGGRGSVWSAHLVLLGGFILRATLLAIPPPLLALAR